MNSEQLRSVLKSRPLINVQWRVYADNQEVLNDDDSQPFLHSLRTQETALFALDTNLTTQSQIYRLSLASGTVPSSNSYWEISFDDGVTKTPVKILRIEQKRQNSDYSIHLLLQ